jgi:chromosome segregation ATPase
VIVDHGGVAEEQRGLADLRRDAADVSARRERVWEAFESGSLRRDTVQQRLDDLTARETEARASILRTEAELAAMKARAASVDEAQGLVAMARRVWEHAAVPDRKALARAVCEALGGLVVIEAGELVAGGVVVAEPSEAA